MPTLEFASVEDQKRRESAEKSHRILRGRSLFVDGATFQVTGFDFEEGFSVSKETGELESQPSSSSCPVLLTDKCGSLFLSMITNIYFDLETKKFCKSEGEFSDLVRSTIEDYRKKYFADKTFDACDKAMLTAIVKACERKLVRVSRPAPITYLDYFGKPRTKQLVNLDIAGEAEPTKDAKDSAKTPRRTKQ